jgi:flagellar motility protein MotE (MotC chaperone)
VKFVLVPLLMVGMFVSFSAALVSMLFYTEIVESPTELARILRGQVDPTRLPADLIDPEDRLGRLTELMDEYQSRYQGRLDSMSSARDSLRDLTVAVTALQGELMSQVQRSHVADTTRVRLLREQAAQLAPYYNRMKPAAAAEILEQGTVTDTAAAMLLDSLRPQQTAKIMSSMSAAFAARLTTIMQASLAGRVADAAP